MSALQESEIRLMSDGPGRTKALGAALGKLLQAGDLICLSGQLGAGKTVFSRGIGGGWGAIPPLSSPTYNLAHEHRRAQDETRLLHIDLYRIDGPADAETLGLDDIFDSDDTTIIEWVERIGDILPQARLWIDIELVDTQTRELIIRAQGERYLNLLDGLLRCTALMRT